MNDQASGVDYSRLPDQGASEPVQLVRRALSGCADSFCALIQPYTSRLLVLLIHRHRGNRADAEDVLQESLVRAFQNLERYDQQYDFRVWLYTIAFRISTDQLRKAKRENRRWNDFAAHAPQGVSHPCAVEQRDSVDNLWDLAKEALCEHQFTILWLSIAEQLSHREIAKAVGNSTISIRVALHRAKKKLAACLQKQSISKPTDRQRQSHADLAAFEMGCRR